MKLEITKHGLKQDPRHAQVSLPWRGRELLGDVTGCYRDETTGCVRLTVRHFNGEPWPIDPAAVAVNVLDR
jgi:hypothetical protein